MRSIGLRELRREDAIKLTVSVQELSLDPSFKLELHFAQYDQRDRLMRWMESVAGDGDHVKLGGGS